MRSKPWSIYTKLTIIAEMWKDWDRTEVIEERLIKELQLAGDSNRVDRMTTLNGQIDFLRHIKETWEKPPGEVEIPVKPN